MANSSDFFMADKAELLERANLLTLPNGEATDAWLDIRNINCKVYAEMESELSRDIAQAVRESAPDLEERIALWEDRLLACLIAGWSFEDKLNAESALAFVKNATMYHALIKSKSRSRDVFKKKQPISSKISKKDSGSKKGSTARKKAPSTI